MLNHRKQALLIATMSLSTYPMLAQGIAYPRVPRLGFPSNIIGNQLVDLRFNAQTGHMYARTASPMTKPEAQTLARDVGGHLVTITSAAENSWLVSNYGGSEPFWIGLSDEGHEGRFVWESGEAFSYANWGTTAEPNNCHLLPPCQPENDVVFNEHRPGGWNNLSRIYFTSFRAIVEVPAVYIGVYSRGQGSASNDHGHAFLSVILPRAADGWYVERRYGFYPRGFGDPFVYSQACIDAHLDASWECRVLYWVNTHQLTSITASIFGDLGAGNTCPSRIGYSFLFRNCTDWLVSKLAAGGVGALPHTFGGVADPDTLVASMIALTGNNAADCNGGTLNSQVGPQALAYYSMMREALAAPAQLAVRFGLTNSMQSLGTFNASTAVPVVIQLTGTGTNNIGLVAEWGDGSVSYQGALTHAYAMNGVYNARVAIVDQGSVTNYSFVVTVTSGTTPAFVPLNHQVANASTWVNVGIVPAASFALPALAESVAPACGANVRPGLYTGLPRVGTTVIVTTTNFAIPSGNGVLLIGAPATPTLPLPGLCRSSVDYLLPNFAVGLLVPSQSLTELPISLPMASSLLGVRLALQSYLLDGVSALGVSNAIAWLIGV
jgi:hypothetical protein